MFVSSSTIPVNEIQAALNLNRHSFLSRANLIFFGCKKSLVSAMSENAIKNFGHFFLNRLNFPVNYKRLEK